MTGTVLGTNTVGGGGKRQTRPPLRGERLYPPRSSRVYWVLTRLREEIEAIAADLVTIEPNPRPLLIDFGCGDAPYRTFFERSAARYVACDLAGNPAAECILETPGVLPIGTGEADVVLSTQVLEHVVDPAGYLGECARVLRPGGRLVLSTHGVWRYHPDPLDLWRWTSAGLRKIVEDAGFSVLTFRGILGPAAYGLQSWQDAILPRVHWRLQPAVAYCLQYLIMSADRASSPEARDADASHYVLTARKLAN